MGVAVRSLSGEDLRRLIEAATRCLERNADLINSLNVFPVPDGDTGINMVLTMRAVLEQMGEEPDCCSDVGSVAEVMARGALMGARGNSGVILSQFFRGFAEGMRGRRQCRGRDLAAGFHGAAQAAYKAVAKPVEGTMLTVIRAAAKAAQETASSNGGDVPSVWEAARNAAVEALALTPEQLAVLKQAGVVDAGGQGVVALLEGGKAFFLGQEPGSIALQTPGGGQPGTVVVSQEFLAHTESELYGYCIQFMVRGSGLDVDAVRDQMASMAESSVVVGDSTLVKVHVHSLDPGPLFSYGVHLGTLSQVRVDNIDEQHREFMAAHRQPQRVPVGVVAVACGQGLENIFRNLGATAVVHGGQTMNPSVRDLVKAAERVQADQVILLANNPNIVPTAEQAVGLAAKPLLVVPSHTIPQGIAALLAFNPEKDTSENEESMTLALASVRSGEITTAVRDSTIGPWQVREGQCMGFLDGELVAVTDTPSEALMTLLGAAQVPEGGLVTLYWGGDLSSEQTEEAVRQVRERWPGVETELVHGGQPFYHFIVSIE
ncbi:MAG: DAK2 domain-containing protein [Chloroflexi bacterium]|nr:DAK2 domain-containing protein [Chloroflexota bacterium]